MDDERTLAELAAQPIDDVDVAHLAQVRAAFADADPVPPDLVERVHFAAALDAMFAEVAQMTRVPLDALATRSETAGTRTETLTFSADALTAMVTVTRTGADTLRLDGWLAPPSGLDVHLRMREGPELSTTVDDHGRFSFTDLAEGFAQLRFVPVDEAGAAGSPSGGSERDELTVVTPVFQL